MMYYYYYILIYKYNYLVISYPDALIGPVLFPSRPLISSESP